MWEIVRCRGGNVPRKAIFSVLLMKTLSVSVAVFAETRVGRVFWDIKFWQNIFSRNWFTSLDFENLINSKLESPGKTLCFFSSLFLFSMLFIKSILNLWCCIEGVWEFFWESLSSELNIVSKYNYSLLFRKFLIHKYGNTGKKYLDVESINFLSLF